MISRRNNIITTGEIQLDDKILGGLGNVCYKYMKKHSDNISQIDAATGKRETYGSLLRKSIRTSIMLQKKGITKGDIITYYSKIHMDACVPLVASFFIGAIPSFIDDGLLPSDIKHILKLLKPKLLLTDEEYLQKVKDACEAHINTEIVVFDESFFHYQNEEEAFQPIYVENLKEMAAIYFSSGSTGLPKGICVSHYTLLCFEFLEEERHSMEGRQLIVFSYDSFYWSAEMMGFISFIRQGICRLIHSKKFDVKQAWYMFEKYKVNVAYLLPCHIIEMCLCGKPQDIKLRSLMTIYPEGSSLPKKFEQLLQEMLPHIDIFRCYGLTEVGLLTIFDKTDLHRAYNGEKKESIGLPVTGVGISYKVAALDTREALGPNKPGELCVKSKTAMLGYYNQDRLDCFDEDGWFKTGDIVYYDDDFCFYITGRLKDLIICRGWHVAPATLEAELLNHPAVEKAVVIGLPHCRDGERPFGVVVLKSEVDASAGDIEAYIQAKVPDQPMKIKIVKELPVTVTGKVKKEELKKSILSMDI